MMICPDSGLISVPMCDNREGARPAERLERILPDVPSGAVDVLLTDFEGVTALWERDRFAV